MSYIHPDPALGLGRVLDGLEISDPNGGPSVFLSTGPHLPIDERGQSIVSKLPFVEFRVTPNGSPPGPRMTREVTVQVHGKERQSIDTAENLVALLSGGPVLTPEGQLDRITLDQHPHHLPNGPLMTQGVWTAAFTLLCRTRGAYQA